ncbi:hypothetical protein KAI87_07805, partial [Myxococcota bacterium]|nr:hypothetical protein [Myxococcota bacterium]
MSIATTRKQLLLSLALISLFSACFAGPPPASTTDYCLNEDGGNCPAGFVCVDNSCAALCQSSLDCESPLDACLDGYCAPYMSICDVSAECAEGWYCDTDVCRKKQNNGVVCGSDSEVCASNFCIDGVCCEALCDDSCVACAETLTGVENGKCQNTLEGEDPRDDCPGPLSCNGDGECFTLAQGNSCSDNFECSTGHCADGI